jgi:RNA polymerase sigma-B factor
MSTSTSHRPDPAPVARNTPMSRAARQARTAECLAEASQTDDPELHRQLLDEVVVLNMPVARSIAHRFQRKGITDEDLHQVAYVALVRAARDYDVSFDRDFLSYAVPTIRGELKKHFRDVGWTVRPPRRVQELQSRIAAVTGELTQELGRSPRPGELADRLGEDLDHVLEALATEGCFIPASLDRPLVEGADTSLAESLDDSDDPFTAADARLLLAPLVRRLSERDRRIIDLRFFQDRTQQEIADDIGVTQMHVSRLITRILAELRDELTEDGTARELIPT